MPFLTFFLKNFEGVCDASLASASDCEFTAHNGKTEENEESEVNEYEECAAVCTGDDRETVDIPETDCTSRRDEDEAQSLTEFFSLIHKNSPFLKL